MTIAVLIPTVVAPGLAVVRASPDPRPRAAAVAGGRPAALRSRRPRPGTVPAAADTATHGGS